MDEAALELLRTNSGLRLDRDGRLWHFGEPVEHPGVDRAFRRGLGRAPDGRATITVGRTWAYVVAEGPLYQVLDISLGEAGERLVHASVRLDDGTEEPL